jgi:cell division protein ZapB
MDLLAKLNEKIDTLLSKYEKAMEENARLNNEINNLKQRLEEKELELVECKENMALKELELEEVLAKIEAILGK